MLLDSSQLRDDRFHITRPTVLFLIGMFCRHTDLAKALLRLINKYGADCKPIFLLLNGMYGR